MRGINVHSFNVRGLSHIHRNIRISKKFASYGFPKYDAYIFSGVWCISAAANCHPNILYLHTPMRAIYDLKEHFLEKSNLVKRIMLRKFIKYWTQRDKSYMRDFDRITTNSKNVSKRALKYYGKGLYKKTSIVYTGIDTRRYKWKKDRGFYLSAARLDPLKRIDMIINAFRMMPARKLIIVGSGPDERRLKKLAAGCRNISFTGAVSDRRMLQLYGMCRATIAANINEDLGLAAIESHASGKPVIAIKEGGFLETVNSSNGVFFSREDEIPKAVEKVERTKWDHSKIRKSAAKFDINIFAEKIKKILKEVQKRQTLLHKHKRTN